MNVGDSMIKHVNGREVSRDNLIKIRFHPGATTDDFIDYVRPTARKKPDIIIIHTSTNDIQNNYFPFNDKTYPKRYKFLLCFTFITECTVITILNMILSAILLF